MATPIGNLRDITLRALDILSEADAIICEDTRVTRVLLSAYRITAPMVPYHDRNAGRMRPQLLDRLKTGAILALVTDAGMPLIADPGYRLVRAAIEANVHVTVVPGPSAAIAALVLSALPTDRFLFTGFLPPRRAVRHKVLRELRELSSTLVFFESPKRLPASLVDMAAILGPREVAMVRELTKVFEEVRRGRLDALAAHYVQAGPPKGEVVVVVGPPAKANDRNENDELDARLRVALKAMSLRDAVAAVTAATGSPRRRVYARALELSGREGE